MKVAVFAGSYSPPPRVVFRAVVLVAFSRVMAGEPRSVPSPSQNPCFFMWTGLGSTYRAVHRLLPPPNLLSFSSIVLLCFSAIFWTLTPSTSIGFSLFLVFILLVDRYGRPRRLLRLRLPRAGMAEENGRAVPGSLFFPEKTELWICFFLHNLCVFLFQISIEGALRHALLSFSTRLLDELEPRAAQVPPNFHNDEIRRVDADRFPCL